jgi:hypothetical protein
MKCSTRTDTKGCAVAKWERVTVIGNAEFSRMPHDGLFIWRRVRALDTEEVEIRYCWDGDAKVRASLTETIAVANGKLP